MLCNAASQHVIWRRTREQQQEMIVTVQYKPGMLTVWVAVGKWLAYQLAMLCFVSIVIASAFTEPQKGVFRRYIL